MIELRWIVTGDRRNLQYRQEVKQANEHGIFWEWTDWKEVEHYYEPYNELKS